jgi:hypothetical protein
MKKGKAKGHVHVLRGEGNKDKDCRQQTTTVKVFYRMYTSVFNRKLGDSSLETILTVLYMIHHILVHIAGSCQSSIFATFLFHWS